MPNNRDICAKCMCHIIDSECGCSDELTASPVDPEVSKQEAARLMSELLNNGDFFKFTPEEKHQFEMARLAEQAPLPKCIIGLAC